MNTYWVFENIREDSSFYTELDTLLLLSSAHLWKKHHPSFTTILCADKLTLDHLDKIKSTSMYAVLLFAYEKVEKKIMQTLIKQIVLNFCIKMRFQD